MSQPRPCYSPQPLDGRTCDDVCFYDPKPARKYTTVTSYTLPDIPKTVAVCPVCGAPVIITEIDEWSEDGTVGETGVKVDCSTAPEDDGDWGEWCDGHGWDMPYVYWLPVSVQVTRWFNENYRYEFVD